MISSRPKLEFWYDFASTYSYLTSMRVDALAAQAGVEAIWRPFLLGPIFKAQGWNTSPFNIYPAKGRYMLRDLERVCAARGLPFRLPNPFPANSLLAARLALTSDDDAWVARFSQSVFKAEFAEGRQISDPTTMKSILQQSCPDPGRHLALAETTEIKQALRSQTDRAIALGIFGAPAFVSEDGELFWGDDRLVQALQHAKNS